MRIYQHKRLSFLSFSPFLQLKNQHRVCGFHCFNFFLCALQFILLFFFSVHKKRPQIFFSVLGDVKMFPFRKGYVALAETGVMAGYRYCLGELKEL